MVAPRKYPDELRERAVRLVIDARKDPVTRPAAVRRIGEQLGINPETLRGWANQAEVDAGSRGGVTTGDTASTSAWLARPRNVSGLIPSCSPILRTAAGRVTGSFLASITSRTARSRSSSGYFRGATI